MDVLIDEYLRLIRVLDRRMGASDPFVWLLDDRGPGTSQGPALTLVEIADNAERLAASFTDLPGARATWLAEHAHALRAAAMRAKGRTPSLTEQVEQVLGVDGGWVPEKVFEEAYELLDRGLPRTSGTLKERLERWRNEHSAPAGSPERVGALFRAAVAEALARTRALVDLPEEVEIDLAIEPGPFRGLHRGGGKGTVYFDPNLPFTTADLFYVVAHEAFPGHIAEYMLKESTLADRPEMAVRFMPSPSFVISEGLGLHAERVIFPGDEAMRWLVDHVDGFVDDGTDLHAVHRARTLLWGAWCNAAHLLAEGRPVVEARTYLRDTALIGEDETADATAYLGPYVFAYYHGARLLEPHVNDPDTLRRLLTDQVPLAELAAGCSSSSGKVDRP